jgi:hypothetical protein
VVRAIIYIIRKSGALEARIARTEVDELRTPGDPDCGATPAEQVTNVLRRPAI